ncbi:unnamed protein product [Rotaria socialis]
MTHSSEQIEVPENTHASPCDTNVHSTPTINKRTRDDVGHSFENENENEANTTTLSLRENDGWQSSHRNNKKFITSRNRTFHNSNHSQNNVQTSSTNQQRASDQISNQQQPVNKNEHVITNQARRFATTRYPFPPFIVHFKEDIRDKLVVEHLVKNAKEQCNHFDLRVLGYRRTQTNYAVAEYDVLIFVENTIICFFT